MNPRAVASAAALALALLTARAAAENPPPCDWKFEFYGLGEGTVSCTCGPPADFLLAEALGELSEELGAKRPAYQGSIVQTVGSAAGTWTYAPSSNVCMAAIHAGLIPSQQEGGIVTFAASPGCSAYEGSEQNDIATYDRGAAGASYYFPALTRGSCPGAQGYASLYDGPPASEIVPQMIELALPRGGARIGTVESLGHEGLAIDGLTLVPNPGKSQPIRIGRLVIARIDLQHLLVRLPPRYLTLRAEDVSLPTKDLPPFLVGVFGGQRVKGTLSVDWVYNPAKRELALRGAVLSIDGYGTLRLRARLDAIPAYAGLYARPEAVQPRWVRVWVEGQPWLAALLAQVLGVADRTAVAEAAVGWLAAVTPAEPTPRQQALLRQVSHWIAGGAEAQLLLQPVEPASIETLGALFAGDPFAFAEATRLALVQQGGAADATESPDGVLLEASRPFFESEERVALDYAGAGDVRGWIALHQAGEAPDHYVRGSYALPAATDGRVDVGPLPAGIYEAVLWLADGAGSDRPVAFAWFAVR